MSKHNQMTPAPWNLTWDDNGFHFVWADEGMPRPYICATGRSDPDDINEANVKAIVTAVNGTYGCGINPEAVKGLYDALERMIDMGGYRPYGNGQEPLEDGFPERFEKARAAIEKCKL